MTFGTTIIQSHLAMTDRVAFALVLVETGDGGRGVAGVEAGGASPSSRISSEMERVAG